MPQDRFLFPFPFINLSHPLHPLLLSIHLSLCYLSIFLPSFNLSLFDSFTTIYLYFLTSIHLSPSSISLSLSLLKCIIWIHSQLGQNYIASHQLCEDQSVCPFFTLFASAKRLTDYPSLPLRNVCLSC